MKKSISARLGGMLVSTFLPLNLLAIILCSIIINQSSNQVQDAYQRETDTAMNGLISDLENIEQRFSEFLVSYMTELTLEEGNDQLMTLEMLEDFYGGLKGSGHSGMGYLYDKEGERLYLRYTQGAYGILEIEALKAELEERIPELWSAEDGGAGEETGNSEAATDDISQGIGNPEPAGKWTFLSLQSGRFLVREYEYTNYYAGFLLDMEKYLDRLGTSELWRRNRVYLQSAGQIYSFQGGRLRPYTDSGWEELFSRWYLARNIFWEAQGMDLQLGLRVVDQEFRVGIPPLYWGLFGVACGSVLLAVWMWIGLKKRVVHALRTVNRGMRELEQEHLDYRISGWDARETEEFVFLYNSFNRMAQEIGLSREKDAKMYQAQLDNLRLQVNPHMLLNSFNMIYSLAQSRNYQCIQEYSLLLVEYFRYALKETDRFVTLEKEMDFVENYVNIQKIRFPGAFTSVHRIGPDCQEALVPPLLIENFVENAMKYALVSGSTIEVLINIRQEEGHLLISVCDTGRGIKPEILDCLQRGEVYRDKMGKEHIGVWNCRRRMEMFYGGAASMKITSSLGQGTQVWLDVPFMTVEPEGGSGTRGPAGEAGTQEDAAGEKSRPGQAVRVR